MASNKVKSREATVHISINKEESVSFKLKSNDTPGIGDNQGRSKQFLNWISQNHRVLVIGFEKQFESIERVP